MQLTDTSEKNIINVVEQFDYSTQDDGYNQSFIKWRKNKDNPYSFNFKMDRRESVFVDGKGFESKSLPTAERNCVIKIMNVAGIAMLMWVVIDNIISKAVISLFSFLGFDIHTSFFSTGFYGGDVEIVTSLILIGLMKVILPAWYVHWKLKMPLKAQYMTRLRHSSDMIATLCMSLAASAVTSLPNIYTNRTRQVFNYFREIDADATAWDQQQFIIYAIFDIVVVSVMSELFFRGAIFGALRQFGDLFAVVVTSMMSALLVQDVREFPAALLMSAIAAAGMLRSGSILTAVYVQIIFKLYRMALILLESTSVDSAFLKRNIFILAVFIFGVAGVSLLYILGKKKNHHRIASYKSEITMWQRLVIAFRSYPVPAVVGVCVMAALIKLIL
ncbi:MAG: CPBP family intramembrane metalloprotease [Ruminococcus sp.]|uniref:CAAX protease self-immunity n=1 Tax=Ruminococcus flavefaciens TaxID=1265 RepID=A0A1K1NXH4_RUMFL|nr:CPBP family intramembrane glutamic endopeptidase [Ruminococcus flavefaciens]MBQ6034572.1 CPBP family intramembrane metalloprotease [Ruminococcus sp.]SFW39971.1 CAAX protease self-immunity [Ruminococcus flavefaciens]